MNELKRASSGTLNEGLPVRAFAHAFEEGLSFRAFMHAFEESFPVAAFSHAFGEAFPVRVFAHAVKKGMICFFSPFVVGRHMVEKLGPREELPPERAYSRHAE
jgi:hypothetical protein